MSKLAPLSSHLESLRLVLAKTLLSIFLATALAFVYKDHLTSFLTRPYSETSRTPLSYDIYMQEESYRAQPGEILIPLKELGSAKSALLLKPKKSRLLLLHPLEGITSTLTLCLFAGTALSSPFWLYILTDFITPALKKKEREPFLLFLNLSLLFMSTGALFAYFITIPCANSFFQNFNSSLGLNSWSFQAYMHYSTFLIFSSALLFEIGALLLFLTHLQVISYAFLARNRKPVILLAFVLGALFTPPDIFTQFFAALLLIAFYEIALFFAHRKLKAKVKGALPFFQ